MKIRWSVSLNRPSIRRIESSIDDPIMECGRLIVWSTMSSRDVFKKDIYISIETDKLKICQLKNNPGYDFMFQVATFKKWESKRT